MGSLSQTWLSDFTFTFHFHVLEKKMATHSSALAWRIPGMEEPGGLPSMGSHKVGHDWSDLAAAWWFIRGYWIQFPVLYSRILLFTHFIYNGLHLLTSNSHSILSPHSPLAITNLFCMSVSLFLFQGWVHSCHILDFTYKWYHMAFVFLFLTYFTFT